MSSKIQFSSFFKIIYVFVILNTYQVNSTPLPVPQVFSTILTGLRQAGVEAAEEGAEILAKDPAGGLEVEAEVAGHSGISGHSAVVKAMPTIIKGGQAILGNDIAGIFSENFSFNTPRIVTNYGASSNTAMLRSFRKTFTGDASQIIEESGNMFINRPSTSNIANELKPNIVRQFQQFSSTTVKNEEMLPPRSSYVPKYRINRLNLETEQQPSTSSSVKRKLTETITSNPKVLKSSSSIDDDIMNEKQLDELVNKRFEKDVENKS